MFATIAGNMLIYVIGSTIISIGLGLGLALLLFKDFRGNHVFRTLMYVQPAHRHRHPRTCSAYCGSEVGLADVS